MFVNLTCTNQTPVYLNIKPGPKEVLFRQVSLYYRYLIITIHSYNVVLTFHTVSDIFWFFDLCDLHIVWHIIWFQIIITEIYSIIDQYKNNLFMKWMLFHQVGFCSYKFKLKLIGVTISHQFTWLLEMGFFENYTGIINHT